MVYKVQRDDLKRKYSWFRNPVANTASNRQDMVEIDRKEGHEILSVIQELYDERGWDTAKWASIIEAYLYTDSLVNVTSRQRLVELLRKNFPR